VLLAGRSGVKESQSVHRAGMSETKKKEWGYAYTVGKP